MGGRGNGTRSGGGGDGDDDGCVGIFRSVACHPGGSCTSFLPSSFLPTEINNPDAESG